MLDKLSVFYWISWLSSLAVLIFYGVGYWWMMYAVYPGVPLGNVYQIIMIFTGLYAIVGLAIFLVFGGTEWL